MEPDLPVSVRPAILRFPCKIQWKVSLGSPGPMFYGTFCGPNNGAQCHDCRGLKHVGKVCLQKQHRDGGVEQAKRRMAGRLALLGFEHPQSGEARIQI